MSLDLLLSRLPARKTLSQRYSLIRWIVYTFLGGAINTVALLLFANLYNNDVTYSPLTNTTAFNGWGALAQVVLAAFLILFIPIILSLIFSKLSPELQIVSPLFMQLLSLALLLFFMVTQHVIQFGNVFPVGVYTILGGFVQDITACKLIGQTIDKDSVITTSMVVETACSNLQSVLQTKKFRETLHLSKKIEEVRGNVVFRSNSDFEYNIIMMLTKGEQEKETLIDIAVFKKGKYALEKTEELEEFAKHQQLDVLRGIFKRTVIHARNCKKTPEKHAEILNELVEEELKGKVSLLEKMPASNWIKLFGVFVSIILCVVGYYEGWLQLDVTLAILIPTIVYALFELIPARERGEQ